MRKNIAALGALALLAGLGACSSDSEDGTEQTAGNEADGSTAQLKPGKYEMTVKVVDMQMPKMPGMPDNAGEMFKQSIESTSNYCVTPEQAKESAFAKARENAEKQMGGECEIEKDSNTSTHLDMTVACTPDGGTMRMNMTGDLTPDGIKILMKADGNIGGEEMSFTTEHTSKYVGECDEESSGEA